MNLNLYTLLNNTFSENRIYFSAILRIFTLPLFWC